MTRTTAGGGGVWCDNTQTDPILAVGKLAGCPDASICYYDGTRTFFNIAEYTGNQQWKNCARALFSFYSLHYVLPNNGGVPTNRVFPEGATLMASLDGRARTAVFDLRNTTNLSFGFMPRVGEDRANAYALRYCAVLAKSWQNVGSPYCQDFLDGVISQALFYTQPDGAGYQTFVIGLMCEALISYWENVGHDPRIPYVIKRLIDDVWAHYDQVNHVIMYNTGADLGPYCTGTPLPFQSDTGGNCQMHAGPKLHNLISPAFAWFWKYSGDDTYRVEGDDLFQNGLAEPTAKEFSEIFRWSFKYVQWRKGR